MSVPDPEPMPTTPTNPTQATNIRALADELGVSIGTVSRALNNRPRVSPQTRRRVLEAARRAGFVPNPNARRLKAHPILRLGMLSVPYRGPKGEVNPYAHNLVQAIARVSEERGLHFARIDFSPDQPIESVFPSGATDAVILQGNIPARAYRYLAEQGVPTVNIQADSGCPNQVGIFSNALAAAERAVEYLAALGHMRFALVTGPAASSHFRNYRAGFDRAIREFGLAAPDAWRIELTPETANADGAAEAVTPLLQQLDPPTAFVFASDWLALGAYRAAQRLGLRVGHDLAVIGYDNLASSAELNPPLTSFDVDMAELGNTVVQVCISLVNGRADTATSRMLHTHHSLIRRGSCHCLRHVGQE